VAFYETTERVVNATDLEVNSDFSVETKPSSVACSVEIRPSSVEIRPCSVEIRPSSVEMRPSSVEIRPSSVEIRLCSVFSMCPPPQP
jgi:hypothetical protein